MAASFEVYCRFVVLGCSVCPSSRYWQIRAVYIDRTLEEQRETAGAPWEPDEDFAQMGRVLERRAVHTAKEREQQAREQAKAPQFRGTAPLYGHYQRQSKPRVWHQVICLKATPFRRCWCDSSSKHLSSPDNVGIVKGIQQQQVKTVQLEVREPFPSNSPHSSPKKPNYLGSDSSDRGLLESPSHRVAPAPPPYRDPPPPSSNINNDKLRKNIFPVRQCRLAGNTGLFVGFCRPRPNGTPKPDNLPKIVLSIMLNIGN